jgi:imidazolonepropionase-like amidohydrolase
MAVLYAGGLVFDGEGRTLDGHGVLVEGERIRRVAPAGEFAGWAGPRCDTAGGALLPGLIDCHVHLMMAGEGDPAVPLMKLAPGELTIRAFEHALATLKGGVTSVRDCGGKDYLEFAVRDACNQGRLIGPTIRAVGRMICMTGGHGNLWGRVADGVTEVVKAVREQVHAGSDVIKIMATGGVMTRGVNPEDAHYSRDEMAAGVAEGHRFHKSCASHAQGTDGIMNAVTAGIDSIEHGIFMDDACIEAMKARGTYLVPTIAAVRNILAHAAEVPAYAYEKCVRIGERHRDSIQRFYRAGGLIAMGTDAGTPFNRHGENGQELAFMVELGITPADAIRISTANAARLMRLDDRGRIAEGAAADLLVVDGHPVRDIRAVADRRNHRLVIKNGAVVHARADADGVGLPSIAAI